MDKKWFKDQENIDRMEFEDLKLLDSIYNRRGIMGLLGFAGGFLIQKAGTNTELYAKAQKHNKNSIVLGFGILPFITAAIVDTPTRFE